MRSDPALPASPAASAVVMRSRTWGVHSSVRNCSKRLAPTLRRRAGEGGLEGPYLVDGAVEVGGVVVDVAADVGRLIAGHVGGADVGVGDDEAAVDAELDRGVLHGAAHAVEVPVGVGRVHAG